jgi:apolipoprotein N-acyltransferase
MESSIQSGTVVAVAPEPAPHLTVPARQAPRALFLLLASLATAGLLWLCYFPADCGWLAWFALVPWLVLVRTTARPWFVYFCAWIAGLAFYLPALQWMRVADPRMVYTWIILTIYCSLYFPLALYLVRFLDRRTGLPLALTLPAAWTALEFFRCWFATGFSWYLLGHTQHDFLHVIQFADLVGAYGVSFLVAAVNAALFEAFYRWGWFRSRFAGPDAPAPGRWSLFLAQAGVVTATLLAAVGYGEWRMRQDAFTPGPRIALIQGNVPQQIRNDVDMAGQMNHHFMGLCDLASTQKPDLIVWPESSYPNGWADASGLNAAGRQAADVPDDWEDRQRKSLHVAERWSTNVLLGTDVYVLAAGRPAGIFNSAVLFDREGRTTGRYDKIHCVPFGEYVPLRDWCPWMKVFAPYDFDYSVTPGHEMTHFAMDAGSDRRFAFGVAICYEDADPDRTRPYAGGDGKPPVDFLLNISNDGWFDGTSEHDEHLAICRFRAIECRRSIGRAVNMGISALIDGDGRVIAPQPVAGMEWDAEIVRKTIHKEDDDLFPADHRAAVWQASPSPSGDSLPTARWADYKKTPCVLLADVPIDHRVSLYALWGDWLPWSFWALLGAGYVFGIMRRRAPAQTAPALPCPQASENRYSSNRSPRL